MIAFRVATGVTQHFVMRLPEWANTIILLMFGATLLQSGNTFDKPDFSVMARYASEDTWGWALVIIASVRLTALVLNGTFKWFAPWSIRLRAGTATLCCFAWFCIASGLFFGAPAATGWKTYTIHLFIDMILAIYLGGHAGKVDRGIWNGRA